MSRWYGSRIRQGYRPHPRHWEGLAKLASVSGWLSLFHPLCSRASSRRNWRRRQLKNVD